jgi:hypothetical protein
MAKWCGSAPASTSATARCRLPQPPPPGVPGSRRGGRGWPPPARQPRQRSCQGGCGVVDPAGALGGRATRAVGGNWAIPGGGGPGGGAEGRSPAASQGDRGAPEGRLGPSAPNEGDHRSGKLPVLGKWPKPSKRPRQCQGEWQPGASSTSRASLRTAPSAPVSGSRWRVILGGRSIPPLWDSRGSTNAPKAPGQQNDALWSVR